MTIVTKIVVYSIKITQAELQIILKH